MGRSALVRSRVGLSIQLPLFRWRLRSNYRLSGCGHRLVSRASLPDYIFGLLLVSDLELYSSVPHASTVFYGT